MELTSEECKEILSGMIGVESEQVNQNVGGAPLFADAVPAAPSMAALIRAMTEDYVCICNVLVKTLHSVKEMPIGWAWQQHYVIAQEALLRQPLTFDPMPSATVRSSLVKQLEGIKEIVKKECCLLKCSALLQGPPECDLKFTHGENVTWYDSRLGVVWQHWRHVKSARRFLSMLQSLSDAQLEGVAVPIAAAARTEVGGMRIMLTPIPVSSRNQVDLEAIFPGASAGLHAALSREPAAPAPTDRVLPLWAFEGLDGRFYVLDAFCRLPHAPPNRCTRLATSFRRDASPEAATEIVARSSCQVLRQWLWTNRERSPPLSVEVLLESVVAQLQQARNGAYSSAMLSELLTPWIHHHFKLPVDSIRSIWGLVCVDEVEKRMRSEIDMCISNPSKSVLLSMAGCEKALGEDQLMRLTVDSVMKGNSGIVPLLLCSYAKKSIRAGDTERALSQLEAAHEQSMGGQEETTLLIAALHATMSTEQDRASPWLRATLSLADRNYASLEVSTPEQKGERRRLVRKIIDAWSCAAKLVQRMISLSLDPLIERKVREVSKILVESGEDPWSVAMERQLCILSLWMVGSSPALRDCDRVAALFCDLKRLNKLAILAPSPSWDDLLLDISCAEILCASHAFSNILTGASAAVVASSAVRQLICSSTSTFEAAQEQVLCRLITLATGIAASGQKLHRILKYFDHCAATVAEDCMAALRDAVRRRECSQGFLDASVCYVKSLCNLRRYPTSSALRLMLCDVADSETTLAYLDTHVELCQKTHAATKIQRNYRRHLEVIRRKSIQHDEDAERATLLQHEYADRVGGSVIKLQSWVRGCQARKCVLALKEKCDALPVDTTESHGVVEEKPEPTAAQPTPPVTPDISPKESGNPEIVDAFEKQMRDVCSLPSTEAVFKGLGVVTAEMVRRVLHLRMRHCPSLESITFDRDCILDAAAKNAVFDAINIPQCNVFHLSFERAEVAQPQPQPPQPAAAAAAATTTARYE